MENVVRQFILSAINSKKPTSETFDDFSKRVEANFEKCIERYSIHDRERLRTVYKSINLKQYYQKLK